MADDVSTPATQNSQATITGAMTRALEQGSGKSGPNLGLAPGASSAPLSQPGDNYVLDDFDVDFDVPAGFQVDFDAPGISETVTEARKFAAELGMDQKTFGRMAGLYVRAQANEYKQLQEASKQQMAALGANGPRRIDAIAQFLTGHLGEGPAKSLLGVLFTKTQVEAFEGLMRLVTSRGVPAPRNTGASGTGRDAPEIRSFGDAVRVMTAATEAAKSSGGRSRRR